MASAAVDHMLSLTIFIAALLVFFGFFSQNMQTAYSYQEHNAMSTKTSDLLDTLLLTPGLPAYWGQNDTAPAGFGLQDPASSQYKLSPFAPMRLSTQSPSAIYGGHLYNNYSSGLGSCILTPVDDGSIRSVTYQKASQLLGVNGTYGFHLSLTPTVQVQVEKTSTSGALQIGVNAGGTGFVLAEANVSLSLIKVNPTASQYPTYSVYTQNGVTDSAGGLSASFTQVNGETDAYALIVYTYIYGLKGVGFYVHVPDQNAASVVPVLDSFQNRQVRLVHSGSVGGASSGSSLYYSSSFAVVTEEYTLRQVLLDQANATGQVSGAAFTALTLPISDPGVLIVAYKDASSGGYGIVLAPWGLGSLALTTDFGGVVAGHDWITTDIRQVTVGGVAYQAKLELWLTYGGA